MLGSISQEELVVSKQSDAFCIVIRQRIKSGEKTAFSTNEEGVLIRIAEEGPKIVLNNDLKERVLYINQKAKLTAYPGRRILY